MLLVSFMPIANSLYLEIDLIIKNTFNKQERLCSRKQIDLLFEKGSKAISFPIKLIYLETDIITVNPCQALFVVPKRAFKRAHDRNRLKRRMKETYRFNKATLYSKLVGNNKKMLCAFVFIGNKEATFEEITKSVVMLITDKIKIE